jgi:hypothetical protein
MVYLCHNWCKQHNILAKIFCTVFVKMLFENDAVNTTVVRFLTTHHIHIMTMKAEVYAFLTSKLDGGEWSASRSRPLYPRRKNPSSHLQKTGWDPDPEWPQRGEDMRTEVVPETSVSSAFNHLTRLVVRESFTAEKISFVVNRTKVVQTVA